MLMMLLLTFAEMEENLNDLDTHLCLVCQQTIEGLMNYVLHKRNGCEKKRPAPRPPQSQEGTFNADSQLYGQSFGQGSGVHQSRVLTNDLPVSSHDSTYGLSSQDSFVLSSLQQDGHFGGQAGSYHHQQSSHSASDHAYTAVQPSSGPDSSGLDVDVTSPLSNFINSAFSPTADNSVDPNSVLQGSGSSQSRPDFFHSLELERKGGEKTAEPPSGRNLRSRRKGLPEEFDVDLPITMILSNLDFSSDEETGVVPFPSDGSDLDASDVEWTEPQPPPQSHTGGKWKPGQGPSKPYHPHQPTGGKWKPGQSPGSKKSKGPKAKYITPFYCNTCKMTFTDRFAYATHIESYEHKEAEEVEKTGKSVRHNPEPPAVSVPSMVLDPSTGEMMQVMAPLKTCRESPASLVKRRQNNVAICETCDLYFDSIKVYDIHCETKQHKDTLAKKTLEIHELMLGSADSSTAQTSENQDQKASVTENGNEGSRPGAAAEQNKKSLPETHFCVVCKKTFARKYEMARHLLTQFHRQRALKHPKALEMLNKYNKYVIRLCPYQCNVCQFYFNRPADLLSHLQTPDHMTNCQDLVGPLLCVTCKYKAQSPDQILEHMKSQPHKQSVARNHHVCIIRESHSKITCKYCGVQMHSSVRMKRHIEYRHKDRKVKDDPKLHTKEKPLLCCPECSMTFRVRFDLMKHYQRKHSEQRPFKCDICNRGFIDSRGLATHNDSAMHKRRARERQLALEYLATVIDSDSETAKEVVVKDPKPKTVKVTKEKRVKKEKKAKKKQAEKRKAEPEELRAAPAIDRPRRSIQRPKRYFGSDSSDTADDSENDSTDDDVNNDEESVSRAIETVLELEKNSESGGPAAAGGNRLPEIHGVDVGPVENMDSDNALEEVLGAIDKDMRDKEQSEMPTELLKLEAEEDGGDDNDTVKEGGDVENAADPDFAEKKSQQRLLVKKLSIFSCKACDFTGEDMEELRSHYSEKHPEEVINCEACSMIFLSTKSYKIHCAGSFHQKNLNSKGVKEELHVCSYCSKKHSDEKAHKLHVEFVHLHVSTEEGIARMCQGRDSVTQLYGEHLKKLANIHFKSSVSCPECGRFFQKNNLIEHLRSHTGERPFKCRHCSKTFSSPNSLRRHLIDHIGIKPIPCKECGKTFKKQNMYNLHMRIHENKKKGVSYVCEICDATFYIEKMLTQHKKRHGDRQYKCEVEGCHWTFILKVELEEHMYTHTREKKYLCDICGFEAGTKTRMRRHAKSHEPAKEIACEYCPYKTPCKIHLKRHMRIHIGAKPFKCLYCAYACNTAENMRKHILQTRKHQGLKLYPCRFCDFQCNCAKEFKQHLHQYHMEYIKKRASESLMVFTGLYKVEEDVTEPPEGGEIHQVMKGRFVKIYDGTRIGGTGEALEPPKKRSKPARRVEAEGGVTTTAQPLQPQMSETESPVAIKMTQEDVVPDTASAVSLVTQQQQPSTSVQAMEVPVYPRGLPWTVVAPNSRPDSWLPRGQVRGSFHCRL